MKIPHVLKMVRNCTQLSLTSMTMDLRSLPSDVLYKLSAYAPSSPSCDDIVVDDIWVQNDLNGGSHAATDVDVLHHDAAHDAHVDDDRSRLNEH